MRIDEVVLWIPVALCNGACQQYRRTDPLGVMESDLKPLTIAYEVYLCFLGRQVRGAVVIIECACEDLP